MTQYQSQFPGYPPTPPMPPMPPAAAPQGPRKYPFVAGYVLFFLPDLWKDAGRKWGGFGFLYMLILLAITWAIPMYIGHIALTKFVGEDFAAFAEQVPAIDIKDGVVSTDAKEPHIISNPETGRPFIVIDTTGKVTEPPEEEPSFLLDENSLSVRNGNKIEKHSLADVKSFHMDKTDVKNWAASLQKLYWPVAYPAMVILSLICRLVWMLILSLIGLAVASSVRPPLGFGALMRLSALACTPVILLDTIFWSVGWSPGCIWLFGGIAIEIGLLVSMVRANNDLPRTPYYPQMPGQPPYGYAPPVGPQVQPYNPALYTPPTPPA